MRRCERNAQFWKEAANVRVNCSCSTYPIQGPNIMLERFRAKPEIVCTLLH